MKDTQEQAWKDIQKKLPDCRSKVLSIITRNDGLTLFQIADILGVEVHCISGRVTELGKLGMIEDSLERRSNPRSGKKAIVWKVPREIEQDQLEMF